MANGLKSYALSDLEQAFSEAGLPRFRVLQVLSWVYSKGACSYDEMTDLPKAMREQLASAYPIHVPRIAQKRISKDGSRKYLLEYHDATLVETVGLPSNDGRLTVCVSSQAGCAIGCVFCATGKIGFDRNLDPGEIVDQVLAVQQDYGERATNVVLMGQGEPFANYEAVMGALRLLNHSKLFNIGARHMTVSTCGLVAGIERFTREPEQFGLAVSLHAARQSVRDSIMPALSGNRLGALRKALDDYAKSTGRRFTFEYALMKGLNDSEEDLEALVEYCRRLLCHVNLIPLNDVDGSAVSASTTERSREWRDRLEGCGIPTSIRRSRGPDIEAACGQLRASVGKSS